MTESKNRSLRRLPSPALIVACVALVVALGGVSYAAGVLPANSVGSKQLRASAVTPSKVSPKTIAMLKRAQDGKATAHAAGRGSLFASVDSGGPLKSGTATAAQRVSEGNYLISFTRDVSACAAIASPGTVRGGHTALTAVGSSHVGRDLSAPNQVEVRFTRPDPTTGTAPADTDFHLIVAC
jgi:hypothetical protein